MRQYNEVSFDETKVSDTHQGIDSNFLNQKS